MATKTITVVYVVITGTGDTIDAAVFHTHARARKHAESVGGTILERTVRSR